MKFRTDLHDRLQQLGKSAPVDDVVLPSPSILDITSEFAGFMAES